MIWICEICKVENSDEDSTCIKCFCERKIDAENTEDEKSKINTKPKHSILGIISFTISLFNAYLSFVFTQGSADGLIGLLALAYTTIPISFILGLIVLFNKKKKRLFAILGMILNLLLLASIIILFIRINR